MPELPHQTGDPSNTNYQYLEDLACGSWYSEVLFTALELDIFSLLTTGCNDLVTFSRQHDFNPENLQRLLDTLQSLSLIEHENGYWFNSALANQYLVRNSKDNLTDFILYRRYIQDGWRKLTAKIAPHKKIESLYKDAHYQQRNFYYVRALDQLARQKALEIKNLVNKINWKGPLLDIGGGAGAISRIFLQQHPDLETTLFEIPEVLEAAKSIYAEKSHEQQLHTLCGDFRSYDFSSNRYGIIILSNFLHAYDRKTSKTLLIKALGLLKHDGLLLIHDYFPDRQTSARKNKGALYDLHMLANTYNGGCETTQTIMSRLRKQGIKKIQIKDLDSDSSLILASNTLTIPDFSHDWSQLAKDMGFRNAVRISPAEVKTAFWVRIKCQSGCPKYGENLQCPPHSNNHQQTEELLASYTKALLVEGSPPGDMFHKQLLKLERMAFLIGNHKAFVMGAGPCPVCTNCHVDKQCRFPEKSRPSMEASGIDVYTTANHAGINLKPLTDKNQYAKYIGLLLIS